MRRRAPDRRNVPTRLAPKHRRARQGRWANVFWLAVVCAVGAAGLLALWKSGWLGGADAEWAAVVAELSERGEPVYFDEVIPPALAEADNFFFAPGLGLGLGGEDGPLGRVVAPEFPLQVSELVGGGAGSLDAIAAAMEKAGLVDAGVDYLSAGDRVLAGMRAAGLDFGPLEGAAARKGARFPTDYGDLAPDLPHLAALEAMGDWLAIRCAAHLSAGNSQAAAVDAVLALRLADAVSSEPFLASQGARRRLLGVFAGCVRGGLESGGWTAAQLEEFERLLAASRALPDFAWGLRGERARANSALREGAEALFPPPSQAYSDWFGDGQPSVPRRVARSRQVAANVFAQRLLDALDGLGAGGVRELRPAEDERARMAPEALAYFEQVRELARDFAQTDAALAHARAACALERHRMQRAGRLPESLDELVPHWMGSVPSDPVAGGPIEFISSPDGFSLVAAGWDPDERWEWRHRAPGKPNP